MKNFISVALQNSPNNSLKHIGGGFPKSSFVKPDKAGDLIKTLLCYAVSFEKACRTSLSCAVRAAMERCTHKDAKRFSHPLEHSVV